MDKDPGPECCTYAVVELNTGMASMKIVQAELGHIAVIDRLWYRTPFALQRPRNCDDVEPLNALRDLLSGFCRAARDYAVHSIYIIISNMYAWRDDAARIAGEMNMIVITPDCRRYADMVLAAASNALGGDNGRRLFVIPGSSDTFVVSGDGKFAYRLFMGMDRGRFDNLLGIARISEKRQRKRGARRDMLLTLLHDETDACVRFLSAPEMGNYKLFMCVDFPNGIIAPGNYTSRQFSHMTDEMAHRLSKMGVQFCYAMDEYEFYSESFKSNCLRRAHNAMQLANAVCARLGALDVGIVAVSAMDAIVNSLSQSGACIQNAGHDFALAQRGVRNYAAQHGAGQLQCDRVIDLARLIVDAMKFAFDESELLLTQELIELAAVLKECVFSDDAQLARDVDMLPGLGMQVRNMLCKICAFSYDSSNEEVLSTIICKASMDEQYDETLFASDLSASDEFAVNDDDYADDEYMSASAEKTDDIADTAEDEQMINGYMYIKPSPQMPLELRVMAVLYIAKALNASGRARMSGFSAKLGKRGLLLRASVQENAMLETLTFKYRAELFSKVFGLNIRFKPDKRHNRI